MCEAGRVVVAYKGSLYDVTNFTGHPGGVGRLQMAAGSDLEVKIVKTQDPGGSIWIDFVSTGLLEGIHTTQPWTHWSLHVSVQDWRSHP